MTPAQLHAALIPHFTEEIAEFKRTFANARLRTFIIKSALVTELVPAAANIKGLKVCSKCFSRAEWLQVSTAHIIPYCEKHHPKPQVDGS